MHRHRTLALLLLAAAAAVSTYGLVACDTETATSALVDNGYPPGDADRVVVYKVWWQTTLFADPVAPGASSAAERTVPGTDYAYALLAPDWDPTSTTPPTKLIPVQSKYPFHVNRGETLHIGLSDDAFLGHCPSSGPLTQAQADFITQRIFSSEFADVTYDATTCVATPIAGDADGGADDDAAARDGDAATDDGPDADAGSDAPEDG